MRGVTPLEGGWRLELESKSALVKKYIPQLTIDISTPGLTLLATTMQFIDGSVLKNEFSRPQVNPDIEEALFHPQLGPDYKITQPLSEGAP